MSRPTDKQSLTGRRPKITGQPIFKQLSEKTKYYDISESKKVKTIIPMCKQEWRATDNYA
jgi:hypothetical protein